MGRDENWHLDDAPRLDGKVAIVTGATGGLGFETALGLAGRGASTVLAGRDADKGARAVSRIQRAVVGAIVRFERLDLASLASVAGFADGYDAGQGAVVDILVNNGGFMGSPERLLTSDGFERQIGVNYLGHFALTARLRPALCAARGGARVISVASLAHRRAALKLDDLQSEASYRPMGAYGQSKLAMLMFAIELQRRSERNGWNLVSIAAHPGWARTDIIRNGIGGGVPGPLGWLIERGFAVVAQSARAGALPLLYAATATAALGGAYYGPSDWGETRGPPAPSMIAPQAADPVAARRLWELSERLTGVRFDDDDAGELDPAGPAPG
ncbi:oxidoreductase [Rhodopila sp.]|uniref:oxidoreductase n=1 Tax=Rhodopila sp. TaxID=2480087 RepID=UPI003D0F1ACD